MYPGRSRRNWILNRIYQSGPTRWPRRSTRHTPIFDPCQKLRLEAFEADSPADFAGSLNSPTTCPPFPTCPTIVLSLYVSASFHFIVFDLNFRFQFTCLLLLTDRSCRTCNVSAFIGSPDMPIIAAFPTFLRCYISLCAVKINKINLFRKINLVTSVAVSTRKDIISR